MRDRPAGVSNRQLTDALAAGWQIDVSSARYAPVGGGSYHWVIRDRTGAHWFATVDDLDDKRWLGDTRETVAAALATAMETAFALRHDAQLPFVLAPIKARNGAATLRLASRYAVAVFPYLNGASGIFGADLPEGERDDLVDMLAALHRAAPAGVRVPPHQLNLARRHDLETALAELGQPWSGGPLSEPARWMLGAAAERVRFLLTRFDQLAGRVATLEPVITHGEPHPGNLLRTGTGTLLIDWDTVGLAPAERDLWWVTGDGSDAVARRYAKATGRPVDSAALALYRLRWALDDLSIFTRRLRSGHDRSADAEHALRAIEITLAGLPA